MIKKAFIILIILISCLLNNNLKAQSPVKDSATYEYALLVLTYDRFNGNMKDFDLEVFLDNNKYLNLFKKLNLEVIKPDEGNKDYTYLFKGLNFMEKMGYELVTSAINSYSRGALGLTFTKEYIFRKKRIQ